MDAHHRSRLSMRHRQVPQTSSNPPQLSSPFSASSTHPFRTFTSWNGSDQLYHWPPSFNLSAPLPSGTSVFIALSQKSTSTLNHCRDHLPSKRWICIFPHALSIRATFLRNSTAISLDVLLQRCANWCGRRIALLKTLSLMQLPYSPSYAPSHYSSKPH